MAVNRKNVTCAQAADMSTTIRQYQNQGCSVKWQSRTGCAMIECNDNNVYVCPTPKNDPGVSVAPHDEMDEPYIDYWKETPE